jgi:DNA-binding transcriptional ArsR family regulator
MVDFKVESFSRRDKMSKKSNDPSLRAQLFRLLGDETRLRIIEILFAGQASVSKLASVLGTEQSLLSHHLAYLRKHNLVNAVGRGKAVYYDLADGIRSSKTPKELDLACCRISFPKKKAQ